MLIFTEAGGFRTKVTLATVMFRTRPAVQYDVTNFIAQKFKKTGAISSNNMMSAAVLTAVTVKFDVSIH